MALEEEREILELLDTAEVGATRRLIDQHKQLLDLGDRIIGQVAALKAINADPTEGATSP